MTDLFDSINKNLDLLWIGNDYPLKILDNDHIQLYRYGILERDVRIKHQLDKREFAVDLVRKNGASPTKVAEALSISKQSIFNWLAAYDKKGIQGLTNNSKDSWKKNPKAYGNKARQEEEERKIEKEENQKQILEINFNEHRDKEEIQPSSESSELFTETYNFEENRYSGSFIYLAIFQKHYSILDFLAKYTGNYGTIVCMFAMMLVNYIGSMEQLKTVFKKEFGRVIGLRKLYSAPIIWAQVHHLVNLRISGKVIKKLFRHQIIKGIVSIYYLFLDGHHLPYSGKHRVHKSFYTQRGMMMSGQTEMFIHDHNGHIVYFDIQEGKGDMVQLIKEVSQEWAELNQGIAPLITVDRELWGVKKFQDMSDCRFVTWEKFCDNSSLDKFSGDLFSKSFEKNKTEYKVYEEAKTYTDNGDGSVTLRRVIFWNIATNERRAVVTNDKYETSETIAQAMLKRWGSNENTFKFMGERMSIHYNPVIDISEQSANQTVTNEEYKKLAKQQQELKTSLSKIEKALGKIEIVTNQNGQLRKNERRDNLLKEKERKQQELMQVKQAIEQCPPQIDLREIQSEKEVELFKVIDKEGKNWWDFAETIVWNSRKKLIEMLRVHLPNERDLIPVLEAITKSRGWVKSTKETITVKLEPLERPQFRAAQIQLCRQLNTMEVRLNGKLLQFDVGKES